MLKETLFIYSPRYLKVLVYMLQNAEYRPSAYLKWFWRTDHFSRVMYRRQLELTRAAKLLLGSLYIGSVIEVTAGIVLFYLGIHNHFAGGWAFGLALLLAYPIVWAHLVVLPLWAGRLLVSLPAERELIAQSEQIFRRHKGIKIAVAGSYGKTTMKEILLSVLSQGFDVAATPANMNVPISHARWAKKLTNQEQILIIEYGEGKPGDIRRFCQVTHPTHAVITGLAPAHLDKYKTLHSAGEDIFSLLEYIPADKVFISNESEAIKPFLQDKLEQFNRHGALGWSVTNVKFDITGTKFKLVKGKARLGFHSGLIGRQHVGYLAFAAALGMNLGLTPEQVQVGIEATRPFEHRMQPYPLNGAWIIDDTYNGNLEGVKAGTELLHELPAQRKLYVTPGLVDQGQEIVSVHQAIGRLIAAAQPDLTVLMDNSVTKYIRSGLKDGGYKGELKVETDPLRFYTNLKHFVAAGDVVLMQNDWPDNYF